MFRCLSACTIAARRLAVTRRHRLHIIGMMTGMLTSRHPEPTAQPRKTYLAHRLRAVSAGADAGGAAAEVASAARPRPCGLLPCEGLLRFAGRSASEPAAGPTLGCRPRFPAAFPSAPEHNSTVCSGRAMPPCSALRTLHLKVITSGSAMTTAVGICGLETYLLRAYQLAAERYGAPTA